MLGVLIGTVITSDIGFGQYRRQMHPSIAAAGAKFICNALGVAVSRPCLKADLMNSLNDHRSLQCGGLAVGPSAGLLLHYLSMWQPHSVVWFLLHGSSTRHLHFVYI